MRNPGNQERTIAKTDITPNTIEIHHSLVHAVHSLGMKSGDPKIKTASTPTAATIAPTKGCKTSDGKPSYTVIAIAIIYVIQPAIQAKISRNGICLT